MAEPTWKAPEINQFLSDIVGKDREKTIRGDRCMFCETPNMNFRDDLSRREYTISGLCQDCQDKTFGIGDDEEDDYIGQHKGCGGVLYFSSEKFYEFRGETHAAVLCEKCGKEIVGNAEIEGGGL